MYEIKDGFCAIFQEIDEHISKEILSNISEKASINQEPSILRCANDRIKLLTGVNAPKLGACDEISHEIKLVSDKTFRYTKSLQQLCLNLGQLVRICYLDYTLFEYIMAQFSL